jgi:hypothetical protein
MKLNSNRERVGARQWIYEMKNAQGLVYFTVLLYGTGAMGAACITLRGGILELTVHNVLAARCLKRAGSLVHNVLAVCWQSVA